ncbi:iron-sulfur cluster repair protein YtfE [Roseomonas sp. PWR1]|uniref:Iron-sulfur cluster repair protein YtfE n=1 Tax=Roseomonas nitratireducens TaxID=2820810 RepID=A0ABS4AS84_9PROT|nr:iron-sulfur cluster repair protein YtfE [Neoroseomonas nitratireducens]MBP0464225.1 iron-sulfur cluster repair protein YtfE [Neoroseomonas nitratireducens]
MSATETGFAARPIGEIAASLPGATAIFRRHKLDFCCGGAARLADAAPAAALPDIEAELATLAPETEDAPQATEALIDHILARYHAVHRRELPELARMARRVEAVHRDHPAVPQGLAVLLERMAFEMEAHMMKEEQALFPMMRAGAPTLSVPIGIMRDDHDDHGARLRELEALTNNHLPPEGACTTWRALYNGTAKFASDLVEHIHLENNVLFPRFGG